MLVLTIKPPSYADDKIFSCIERLRQASFFAYEDYQSRYLHVG